MPKSGDKKEFGEGRGIAGMVLGIFSIFAAGFIGIIISIIGFVLSYKQQKNNPTKIGKAGIILNIIGFVLSILFLLFWFFYLKDVFITAFG